MKPFLISLAFACALSAQTSNYPSSLDNNTSLFVTADNVQTVLTNAMQSSDSVAIVQSSTGFTANMIATICNASVVVTPGVTKCSSWEHMLVTNVSGNVITVTRGFAGTVAASHIAGAVISGLIDSAHQAVLKSAVINIETALGPNLSNVPAAPVVSTSKYIFTPQTPGGSLIIGSNTIALAPCPLGISGSAVSHYLYISGGTGTAEAALMTGGSCTSGAFSGNVIVTAANTHSGAWTIQSATSGLAECHDAVGAYGACSIPAGTFNLYGPYVDSNCSSLHGAGNFQTILSIQFLTGSAMTFSSPSGSPCNFIDTGDYEALPPSGYMSPGSSVMSFINVTDGLVDNITIQGAYVPFAIVGVPRVQFRNMRAYWKGGACWNISGTGPQNFVTAVQIVHAYCAAGDATGQQFAVSNAIDGGIALYDFFFEGGSATCLFIESLSSGLPTNEGIFSNGDCDGPVNGIEFTTSAGANNTNQFENIRVHNSTGVGLLVNGSNAMFDHLYLESATTGPEVVLENGTNVYLRNSEVISGSSGTGLQIQTALTNSFVSGNIIGCAAGSVTGQSAIGVATDSSAIAGVYFSGNRFCGTSTINWAATGAGNLFAPGQVGLPVTAVASAATLPFPPFPDFTVTGTTGITAVSGLISGQSGTVVFTNASPGTISSGATIGNACTTVQNKPYTYHFDGTKVWFFGAGC